MNRKRRGLTAVRFTLLLSLLGAFVVAVGVIPLNGQGPETPVANPVATPTVDRLASYHKLVSEARTAARKSDVRLRLEEKRKWKLISKAAKEYNKRGKRS